jgi:hypothetical protein
MEERKIERNSILMKKYDITPFEMADWRRDGIISTPCRGVSYVDEVIEAKKNSVAIRLSAPCTKPRAPRRDKKVRPSMSHEYAALLLGVTTKRICEMKDRGLLEGRHGRVWQDSFDAHLQRKKERKWIAPKVAVPKVPTAGRINTYRAGSIDYRGSNDW